MPHHQVGAALEVLTWLWLETGASTVADAISEWSASDPPPEVATVARELMTYDLGTLISATPACEVDWQFLLDFSDRELRVLGARVFTSERMTLAELGDQFGVTRERVRQLEQRVLGLLELRVTEEGAWPLRHLATATRRKIGDVARAADVQSAFAAAARESSESHESGALRREILIHLAGPYTDRDGLMFTSRGAAVLVEIQSLVEATPPEQPLPVGGLDVVLAGIRFNPAVREQLFESLGVRTICGRDVVWRRSMGDRAAAVLGAADRTMSMMDLHVQANSLANPRSFANAVQSDDRIMRRGKDSYGLRQWGGEEYSGIFDELEQAIDRAGGQIDLGDTAEKFAKEFGVSVASVRSYAQDPRFFLDSKGHLQMRTASHPVPGVRHIPVETTTGVFLVRGVWHLRIEVTQDILRGSGSPMRRGAALEAGLELELAIGVQFDGGLVTLSWRTQQPSLGSIRGIASKHGCVEGDLLFLPLAGDEPRPCFAVRGIDRARFDGLSRLWLEVGLDPEDADVEDPGRLAHAVGLPAGADWADIADRFYDRRESELLELLPVEWR